jgi:hypothetical protein
MRDDCADYIEVVPIDDDCRDWIRMSDIIEAFETKRVSAPTVIANENVNILSLCPDLEISSMVTNISQDDIKVICEIGLGAYGRVMKAKLSPKMKMIHPSNYLESAAIPSKSTIVAVKTFASNSYLSSYREIYLMSLIRHPHIIHLMGVCDAKDETWVVMEFMKGGDLFSELMDPQRVMKYLRNFYNTFHTKYLENVLSQSKNSIEVELKEEIATLKQSMPHSFSSSVSNLIQVASNAWNQRTKEAIDHFEMNLEKVTWNFSFISLFCHVMFFPFSV